MGRVVHGARAFTIPVFSRSQHRDQRSTNQRNINSHWHLSLSNDVSRLPKLSGIRIEKNTSPPQTDPRHGSLELDFGSPHNSRSRVLLLDRSRSINCLINFKNLI